MEANIAIICGQETNRVRIRKFVEPSANANLFEFESVESLVANHADLVWSALIFDMRTVMKTPSVEWNEFTKLSESIPIMRIRPTPDGFTGIIDFISYVEADLLGYFFGEYVKKFKPRRLRRYPRYNQIWNIKWSLEKSSVENGIKANSYDVSACGIYLISGETLPLGTRIWIYRKDLDEPVSGIVRWALPWGETEKRLPGMGIEFDNLTEHQRTVLKL